MINPIDPQEKPAMFAHLVSSAPAALPPLELGTRMSATAISAAALSADVMSAPEPRDGDFRQFNNFSSRTGGRGQRPARSAGPWSQANVMGGGIRHLAWEDSTSHDSSHGTSSRSRLRPYRVDKSSAENFTSINNETWGDRNTGGGNASSYLKYSSYGERSNKPKKCCFPWW